MSFEETKKAFSNMFDSAAELQWWVIFLVSSAALFLGLIGGGAWAPIVGGSKVIEHILRRRNA